MSVGADLELPPQLLNNLIKSGKALGHKLIDLAVPELPPMVTTPTAPPVGTPLPSGPPPSGGGGVNIGPPIIGKDYPATMIPGTCFLDDGFGHCLVYNPPTPICPEGGVPLPHYANGKLYWLCVRDPRLV